MIPLVFAITTWAVLEGLSFAGLFALRHFAKIDYSPTASMLAPEARENLARFLAEGRGKSMDLEADLGWAPIRGLEDINSAGMRDHRDYAIYAPPGVLRIAAFGDSFTYGSDVSLGENWAKQIPLLAPSVEALDYGVPAYGLDQAYLRYLAGGDDYHPDVVLIGYMSENLARHVNVHRGFYSRAYRDAIFTKPRFRLDEDALVLLPNPLATIDDCRALQAREEARRPLITGAADKPCPRSEIVDDSGRLDRLDVPPAGTQYFGETGTNRAEIAQAR